MDRPKAGETDYSLSLPNISKETHPEAIRTYREEESRYKADRKKTTRARRIIAAKLKRQHNDRGLPPGQKTCLPWTLTL